MTTFLSQGIDYLGFLDGELRNLQGYGTLAHELIQNADDAKATTITFDICQEALIVSNNRTFSDCGAIESEECPWKDTSAKGHRCDFHRFRKVAGGDKREEATTTGAFGIGFISVYQITDRPEIKSGQRHLVIRPDAIEQERIELSTIDGVPEDGATFFLPWATNANSPLRRRLRSQSIQVSVTIESMVSVLSQSLPNAILFLKNLRRIELLQDGQVVKVIERRDHEDRITVQNGQHESHWRILRGSFEKVGAELRTRYASQIEKKRTTNVVVAIPENAQDFTGLFCACLPTEQQTGLPFHINADFYPTTDRKRILFTDDHQGVWNRAALQMAASLVADAVSYLPNWLAPKAVWSFFSRLKATSDQAGGQDADSVMKEFWIQALPKIKVGRTVYTWLGQWFAPSNALLLEHAEEEVALDFLEQAGLKVVHPDLRPYFSLLRQVETRLLTLSELARALQQAGLGTSTEFADAPLWIRRPEIRALLDKEIALRIKRESVEEAQRTVGRCAIALARDNWLYPPTDLFQAPTELVEVLSALCLDESLIAESNSPTIVNLTTNLHLSQMLDLLAEVEPESFSALWSKKKNLLVQLIDWFSNHRKAFVDNSQLRDKVRALPIWPAGQRLYSLDDLVVPGSFDDPLKLATVLDHDIYHTRRDFLIDIKCKRLKLETYVCDLVPRAFAEKGSLAADQCQQLVQVLAKEQGKLQDISEARAALSLCPIVETVSGPICTPQQTYFPSDVVATVLGKEASIIKLPSEGHESIETFYRWLGVAEDPRIGDVIACIRRIVLEKPTKENRKLIGAIFHHLSTREFGVNDANLHSLRFLNWLPIHDDYLNWYQPSQVHAIFQEYLFATQGRFLDFDRPLQSSSSKLIRLLNINSEPTVEQVIAHLLVSSERGESINPEVYRFLNSNHQNISLRAFQDKKCLLVGGNRYILPSHAFWNDHGFGRYRYQLSSDYRKYQDLFKILGVDENPAPEDAVAVLREIAFMNRGVNTILDDETYSVVLNCWQQLDRAWQEELIQKRALTDLSHLSVIPTEGRELLPPDEIFFDDRPSLAERFQGFKQLHTIARMQGIWRPMQVAGVQSLSSAVKVQLVECSDRLPADDLLLRVRERRPLIARVIEAQSSGAESSWNLSKLDQLQIERTSKLVLKYAIQVGGKQWFSEPAEVTAFYDAASRVVYVQQDSVLFWLALARELAYALSDQAEAKHLASDIKEILSADTTVAAIEALNELGIANLDTFESIRIESQVEIIDSSPTHADGDGKSVNELSAAGNDSTETTHSDAARGTFQSSTSAEELEPSHEVSSDSGGQKPQDQTEESLESTATTAKATALPNGSAAGNSAGNETVSGKIGLGQDTPTDWSNSQNGAVKIDDSQKNGNSQIERATPPTTSGSSESGQHDVQRQRGRLRTYVSPERESATDATRSDHAKITATDRAGIERVLQFEREAGRFPTEMAHNNPGYDIESRDATGAIVRYIEVKSTATTWDSMGVALSHVQFKEAYQRGTIYWLYVVERVGSADAVVHPIQNPARRVDQFFYDSGWQQVAANDARTESTAD